MRNSILLEFFSVKDSAVLDFLQETAELFASLRNNKSKLVLTKVPSTKTNQNSQNSDFRSVLTKCLVSVALMSF